MDAQPEALQCSLRNELEIETILSRNEKMQKNILHKFFMLSFAILKPYRLLKLAALSKDLSTEQS